MSSLSKNFQQKYSRVCEFNSHLLRSFSKANNVTIFIGYCNKVLFQRTQRDQSTIRIIKLLQGPSSNNSGALTPMHSANQPTLLCDGKLIAQQN